MFIASDEKLIIDSLEHQERIGNFDEIQKIIENSKIDKKKIIDFLKRNNNDSTIKRVGYLLEKIKKIDISKEFKLNNNYVKLSRLSKKQQNKIDKIASPISCSGVRGTCYVEVPEKKLEKYIEDKKE